MRKLSANFRGAIFIVLSMGCFVTNDGLVKSLADQLAWHQVLALRGTVATLLSVGLVLAVDGRRPVAEVVGYLRTIPVSARLVFEMMATALFVVALMNMPLADATAVNQTLPVLLTVGGALVFKEKVGLRRVIAAGLGFVGVMLIIQPGTATFNPVALVAFAATLMVAGRDLATRALSPAIPSTYVTALSIIAVTIMGWTVTLNSTWPPLDAWIMARIVMAAILVSLAFLFGIMATRIAEISFIAPFRYTALVWGLLIGFFVFGERPGALTLLGAAVVVGAGLYVLYREKKTEIPADR